MDTHWEEDQAHLGGKYGPLHCYGRIAKSLLYRSNVNTLRRSEFDDDNDDRQLYNGNSLNHE